MGALTGIIAGAATIVGAVALVRYAERKTRSLRNSLDEAAKAARGEPDPVIEFEKDPVSGAYRQKEDV